jgi:hypothetical protein
MKSIALGYSFLTFATSNILSYEPSHDDSAESGRVFNAFNVFSVFSPERQHGRFLMFLLVFRRSPSVRGLTAARRSSWKSGMLRI